MAIAVSTSLVPTQKQAPLDVRSVIEDIADAQSVANPYVGLIFYSKNQDAYYKVIQIEQKKIGLSTTNVIKFYQKMPDNTIYNLIENIEQTLENLSTDVAQLKSKQITVQLIQEV